MESDPETDFRPGRGIENATRQPKGTGVVDEASESMHIRKNAYPWSDRNQVDMLRHHRILASEVSYIEVKHYVAIII